MMNARDIIPAVATWIQTAHGVKIAAIQLPNGADSGFIKESVELANAEPIYVSMHGLAGIDLVSAVMSPIAVTFRKKVVVVFEYDAIASSDPTTMATLSVAMKVNRVPFIVISNTFRGKTELPKGHTFFSVQMDDVVPVFRKDKGLTGAEAALSGHITQYCGDGISLGAVFDNYLANPIDPTSIAEAFSVSDVIGEQLCRAGDFDDPYSFIPISATALACKDANVSQSNITTFGSLWSKTNAMHAKSKSARAISKAFLVAGSRVSWTPVTGIDLVRGMMTAEVAKNTGIPAPEILSIMRLWKTKYTLAMHAKIKKHL